jgi:predicted O-methyltransferase YrrM
VQGLSLDSKVLSILPTKIDLLFIDTSHEYKDTLDEITAYLPRLVPGGMIALHDSISQDGVRRAIFDRWPDFETLTFATEFGNGMTVLRAPANKSGSA